MKILHLTGDREDMGGILSVIRALQTATQVWGWRHFVWVNERYTETRQPELAYRYSRHITVDSLSPWVLCWRWLRAFWELRGLLRQEAFDLVHAHARGGFLVGLGIAAWLRRPVLFTNHMYARRTRLYRWATRWPYFYTVVLTPNMARHYGLTVAPPKVRVISEACSDAYFQGPLKRAELPPRSDPVTRMVGIGNVMRWKNWHLVLEAMSQLSPAERSRLEFSVWGPTYSDADSEAYEKELRTRAHQLGMAGQFRLPGMATQVRERLLAADWFVLPSTNEPCSVALIEALASGLPAVASRSGGNIDIVEEEKTGLLFEPEDPADLAAVLRRIVQGDHGIAPPHAIRESVRHRSAMEVANQWRPVYEQLAWPGRRREEGDGPRTAGVAAE